jgi:hypothetical protein
VDVVDLVTGAVEIEVAATVEDDEDHAAVVRSQRRRNGNR